MKSIAIVSRELALRVLLEADRSFQARVAHLPYATRAEVARAIRELALAVFPLDLTRAAALAQLADLFTPIDPRALS